MLQQHVKLPLSLQKELEFIGIIVYIISFVEYYSYLMGVQVIQREQRSFFYISHYSVTEINPFHDGSVTENTTEQVN